jgi:D-3-phosphoglycerate dehydrogenase
MTLRVLVSAPYIIPILDRFRSLFEAEEIELVVPEVVERLAEEELIPFAGKIDGAVCGDDQFTARVLEAAAPRLKVISKWGTGVDSIDRETAERLGIQVCNTPGAFTVPVADSVLGYILAFARRIPWTDYSMKSGGWDKTLARTLKECTLGVVGVGRIGKAVLRRAKVFQMRLLGNDIIPIPEEFIRDVRVEMMALERLLGLADFISLSCDLNPSSHHLINKAAFNHMKPDAVLINTSRGPVVDEEALIESLQTSQIAGAALDVYEDEPLPEDSPLRGMENVLLAPHNANSSPTAWEHVHWNTLRNLFEGLGLILPEESEASIRTK